MNTKKLWLFTIMWVSLLTLAGCAATPSQTQETTEQELSAQVLEVVEPVVEVVTQEESQPQENLQVSGLYTDYNAAAVDQALTDGKKVALFFYASRCPSCRSLDKDLTRSNELPEDTIVFKVDYDTQNDLKKQYGVTSQHTIVLIDQNKNLIQKDTWTKIAKLISLLK